jgi:hypothetical protein
MSHFQWQIHSRSISRFAPGREIRTALQCPIPCEASLRNQFIIHLHIFVGRETLYGSWGERESEKRKKRGWCSRVPRPSAAPNLEISAVSGQVLIAIHGYILICFDKNSE